MGGFSGIQMIYCANRDDMLNLHWVKRGYKRIPIPYIKSFNMSPELILTFCWLGITFFVLELNTRLFLTNVTFTLLDADDYRIFNVSLYLMLCNKLHIITATWVQKICWLIAGSHHHNQCGCYGDGLWLHIFHGSDFFLTKGSLYKLDHLSHTDNNDVILLIIFWNE